MILEDTDDAARLQSNKLYLKISLNPDDGQLVIAASGELSGILVKDELTKSMISSLWEFNRQLSQLINKLSAYRALNSQEGIESHD